MLKYLTGNSADFWCICLARDKGRRDFKRRVCMVEHLLVICRLLAMWTREGKGDNRKTKARKRGREES